MHMTYRQRSRSLLPRCTSWTRGPCPAPNLHREVIIGVEVSIVCRFRDADCWSCGKKGHIARACRSAKKSGSDRAGQSRDSPMKAHPTHMLRTEEAATPPDLPKYTLFLLRGNGVDLVTTSIFINGKSLVMKIDTPLSARRPSV